MRLGAADHHRGLRPRQGLEDARAHRQQLSTRRDRVPAMAHPEDRLRGASL
jgi:hypothetical protein